MNACERSRVRAAQRSLCSYQSSCSDQPAQRRHDVHRHWCPQPGHWPRVSNVFHTAPQPPTNRSGVPALSQHHRLDASGCHAHSGHRIRPNADSSSVAAVLTMAGVVAGPFFKTRRDISPYIVGGSWQHNQNSFRISSAAAGRRRRPPSSSPCTIPRAARSSRGRRSSTQADVDAAVPGGDHGVSRLERNAAGRARAGDVQVQAAARGALRGDRAHRHDRARQDARRSARQRAARHRVRRGRVRRAVAADGLRPRERRAAASTAT